MTVREWLGRWLDGQVLFWPTVVGLGAAAGTVMWLRVVCAR